MNFRKLPYFIGVLITSTCLSFAQDTCMPSSNLGVRNITHQSAEVYWTPGSGSGFKVIHGPSGFTPGGDNGIYTTQNQLRIALSSAFQNQEYHVYVKDSCGPGNYSSWAGPVSFRPGVYPKFSEPMYQSLLPRPCEILAIGDLNNDFRNDVVVGTGYHSDPSKRWKILLYHQTSSNTIGTIPFEYKVGNDTLTTLDIADLNNNLEMDVLVGFGDSIAIYNPKSNGGLRRDTTFFSGLRVYDVQTGDFNNDDRTDFAVYHSGENNIRIFYQDSSAGFSSQAYACPTSKRGELGIGDFNNDGLTDLAVMTGSPPTLNVFHSNASGSFDTPISHQSADTGHHSFEGLAVGNLKGNGYDDIVVSRRNSRGAGWMDTWCQTDSQLKYFNHGYSSGHTLNVGDLNCDGFQDIYGILGKVPPNAGSVHAWYFRYFDPNTNFSHQPSIHITTHYSTSHTDFYRPKSIGLADLNGDHKPDLAVADSVKGLVIFYNTADILPRVISDSSISVHTSTYSDTAHHLMGEVFEKVTKDTIFGYYRNITHYHQVVDTYLIEVTEIDSTKQFHKAFCEHRFIDTAIETSLLRDSILIKTDTLIEVSEVITPWSYEDYDQHLAIYPNPTTGIVHIEIITRTDKLTTLSVDIFDERGKYVLSETLSFIEKGEINLDHLASANYHFVINWNGRRFDRKIIKR